MNISIFINSLRYIKQNYKLVSSLTIWINKYLKVKHFYKHKNNLITTDYKLLKSVIHLFDCDTLYTQFNNYLNTSDFHGTSSDVKLLKLLINNSMDHKFLLVRACQFGHYDIAKLLLDNGARMNNTALTFACLSKLANDTEKESCRDMIKLLLSFGAIPDLDTIKRYRSEIFGDILNEELKLRQC